MTPALRFGLLLALLPALALAQPVTTYSGPAADSTARAAATAAQTDADDVVWADVSAGAEAADKINLSVITKDRNGDAVARAIEYRVEVLSVDGALVADTVATLEEIGVGSHISGDVEPVVLVLTDVNGQMAIQVADVATGAVRGTTLDLIVIFTPQRSALNPGAVLGQPFRISIQFDAA